MEENKSLKISAQINDVFTYALQQNGLELIRSIRIKNTTDAEIGNLVIRIHTDIELTEPYQQAVEILQAGEELEIRNLKILIKGEYLASLTERVSGILYIGIFQGEDELVSENRDIIALAYDEWPGLRYFPDLLATFVTPNHPVVTGLLQSASKWLDKWTGRPSLEGYQSHDPNRVKMMAAAALRRTESRGSHHRADYPEKDPMQEKAIVMDKNTRFI